MESKASEMSKEQFLRADKSVRQRYIAGKSKKQLSKICKAYGLNVHGGAFAMSFALMNLK